ncbi:hypothetical protein D3C87_2053940 [compost metagenome]
MKSDQRKEDPLLQLPELIAAHEAMFSSLADAHMEYNFPGLGVDLHVSHSL